MGEQTMKDVKYVGLMGLAALMIVVAAYAPQLPVWAGNDTANVDIGIIADIVNLNVTATTTAGGVLRIYVNGTEVQRTTVVNYYDHNYDGAITYLRQSIGGIQYTFVAFANYTDGKLSMLLVNDRVLAGWVGVLNSTDPVGQRILGGNSSVVLELSRLDARDDELRAVAEMFALQVNGRVSGLDTRVSGLESGLGSLSATTAGESARQDAVIRVQGDRIAALERTTDTQTILIVLLGVWGVLGVIVLSSLRSAKKIGATPPVSGTS